MFRNRYRAYEAKCPVCGAELQMVAFDCSPEIGSAEHLLAEHIKHRHTFVVEAAGSMTQTDEQVARIHADARFGHGRHEITYVRTIGTYEIRDGGTVVRVAPLREFTFRETPKETL